jgi:hypothetical protein
MIKKLKKKHKYPCIGIGIIAHHEASKEQTTFFNNWSLVFDFYILNTTTYLYMASVANNKVHVR